MKKLVIATILALSTQAALAGNREIEPTTAFSEAYDVAVSAVLDHLNIPSSKLGPAAGVERKKNEPGVFADFVIQLEINRISHDNHSSQCEVRVFIAKGDTQAPGDILLGETQNGHVKTIARITGLHCQ